MEDILSSIKRIIAEEGEEAVQTLPRRVRGEAAPKVSAVPVAEAMSEPASDEVLELTDEVAVEEPMPAHRTSRASKTAAEQGDASILSVESEVAARHRSEEHTSELQSIMRTSYAVFCLTQ